MGAHFYALKMDSSNYLHLFTLNGLDKRFKIIITI
jgi:hypothetical protein